MPDVNDNNTHYMFGRVDTAFGGTVEQMAPHLFGPEANEKPAFEHLEHAVEFEQDAMRVAAQHVTPDAALAAAEQARVDNALQDAADAAAAAADDGEVDTAELEAVVAQLVAAGAAASDARAAADKAAAKAAKKSPKAPKG